MCNKTFLGRKIFRLKINIYIKTCITISEVSLTAFVYRTVQKDFSSFNKTNAARTAGMVLGLKRVLGYSDSGRCQTSTRYWRPTRVLGIYNDRRNTRSRRSKSKPETKCISRKRPQFHRAATDENAWYRLWRISVTVSGPRVPRRKQASGVYKRGSHCSV